MISMPCVTRTAISCPRSRCRTGPNKLAERAETWHLQILGVIADQWTAIIQGNSAYYTFIVLITRHCNKVQLN